MPSKHIKIAILSDLHCHPKRKKDEGKDETYLLTDKLRSPANDHPVQSLLDVITEKELTVDLTLCPGDFTDKANQQGFINGWGYTIEINTKLRSKEIIATVGNHDVDVYETNSNYSLDLAKGIKQGFPIDDDTQCDTFWSKGCVFIEKDLYRVLVINSSHFHHNKSASISGAVNDDLIDYVSKYLKEKNDDKIQIAMSHHHPIDHSALNLGEQDKILNADKLLDVLGDYKFDIFIHGHKHHPLLRYHPTSKSNYMLPIFSSGSFSSSSNLMFTSVRNFFHILEITKDITAKGTVKTWTFFPHIGWKLNHDDSAFATYTGFGSTKNIDKIFQEIVALLEGKNFMEWADVMRQIKDIKHLIPSESHNLFEMLVNNGYKPSAHLWSKPQEIFNKNNMKP
ncbi:metallophosphoesterase [Pedobacter psychrotolerans]|uniref:metallophosphoesterase family protein n=1 Tax=Pedobacter psychrotolerans TaxID=1843235 RepID=UPI003F9AF517